MDERRRGPIAITWALAALSLVLFALLVVSVVSSTSPHSRRGAERPAGGSSHSTSTPTATPDPTADPTPSGTPAPGSGGGSGGGRGVGGGSASGSGGGSGSVDQPSPSYSIAGDLVQYLRPGDTYPLDLTLTNLTGNTMTALDLHVAISHVTAPNATSTHPCTVSDFAAAQVASGFSVALAPHESTSLSARGIPSSQWPQISMLNTAANQDGCKGATLTFVFSGSSAVTP